MSLFGPVNLDAMNETDVREVIVRPLLHRLGYQHGTKANILTEKRLSYSKTFLGRKKPSRDPDLIGRADYICDVVSYGRWVIEVKAPSQPLTLDDAYQAHTYAAHPEIAGIFSLLTNGREFRLYRYSAPEEPIFQWSIEQTDELLPNIENLLGPEAIKRRVHMPVDFAKPLAKGFGSEIKLVGGMIEYERHTSSNVEFKNSMSQLDGMRASVVGKGVIRLDDGRIEGSLQMAGPYTIFDTINQYAGFDILAFTTSDEFVSTDVEVPTIFQNIANAEMPAGMRLPLDSSPLRSMLNLPSNLKEFRLPFGICLTAYTEAIGYIEGTNFRGTFDIDYVMQFNNVPAIVRGMLPSTGNIRSEGTFDILIQ